MYSINHSWVVGQLLHEMLQTLQTDKDQCEACCDGDGAFQFRLSRRVAETGAGFVGADALQAGEEVLRVVLVLYG